jgi:hypothetical protein
MDKPAAPELFSEAGTGSAIMSNDLFLGEAEGNLERARAIAIHSQPNMGATC